MILISHPPHVLYIVFSPEDTKFYAINKSDLGKEMCIVLL